MKKLSLHIEEIDRFDVAEFIQRFHYSPVFPVHTKHWLGVFQDGKMVGAITLGWGTQPKQTIKKLFPSLDTCDYLEIGKMCMDDAMPKNSESQMLKSVVTWIKANRPELKMLYTMADGIMGKCGYVYQASNFLYGGEYWTDVFLTKDGEKVHPRSMKKVLDDNAKFKGVDKLFWPTPCYLRKIGMKRIKGKMFRYMLPLDKGSRKLIQSKGWGLDYPKDKDLAWKVQIDKGVYHFISMPNFSYKKLDLNKKNVDKHTKRQLEINYSESAYRAKNMAGA